MSNWQLAIQVMAASTVRGEQAARQIVLALGAFECDYLDWLRERHWTGDETKKQIRAEMYELLVGKRGTEK